MTEPQFALIIGYLNLIAAFTAPSKAFQRLFMLVALACFITAIGLKLGIHWLVN